jgi:hypothetical protein
MAVELALVNAPTGADRDAIQRPKQAQPTISRLRSGPVSSLLSGEQIFEIEIGVTGKLGGKTLEVAILVAISVVNVTGVYVQRSHLPNSNRSRSFLSRRMRA